MKAKPKKAKSARKSATPPKPGSLVPALNGGSIRHGSLPGNTPGTGRPANEIRAKLRELGLNKGVPFLSDLLDGKVQVSLLGKCDACGHDQPISEELVEHFMDRVKTSVDQRLKATDQVFKNGLTEKELVIASDNAASFFDCVHKAIVELYGAPAAAEVQQRALVLMDAKA